MKIILTHENADFDAIAALLAAHKLNPEAIPVLPERLNGNVSHFITLYQNGLPFVRWRDKPLKGIEQITLVDTQRPVRLPSINSKTFINIIDHHPLRRELQRQEHFTGEVVGAVTTLLVEQIQAQQIPLASLEATLLALGIYEDTGSLTYGTTTSRDIRAAAWLLEHSADLDTVRHFLNPPLSKEQQILLDQLLSNAEHRVIEGHIIIVSAVKTEAYIAEISSIAHRLRDTLDLAALFIAVQLPDNIQLVCRSTDDAIDVGAIARIFGGGGHGRAAAAAIYDKTLDQITELIWQELEQRVLPVARVGDLMSYGVQTIDAQQTIKVVLPLMRHIGHEGFPVIENGRVVGLLTRRAADRAIDHQLGDLKVYEVMTAGSVTLRPEDTISILEREIVETGWGQIPVVDTAGKLLGIVTRTDLIKHWAQTHPELKETPRKITMQQIVGTLGNSAARLVEIVAQHAHECNLNLFMVGGIVRDLLLERNNLDMDFVVEDDAIRLAQDLQAHYGGEVHSFRPFGTAKWLLTLEVQEALKTFNLPSHIDFATARNEFYEHPTALPTVYSGSIKLDLGRRDFTINTLAIQLSPTSALGHVLDFYGGLSDLKAGLIRVLHSLSFIDDPTRIVRAVRFKRRLNFTIEGRTAELIETALPMLGRITGERLRNELTLLLQEQQPELGLFELQRLGILNAIHPAFKIDNRITPLFEKARSFQVPWLMKIPDRIDLYWHLLATTIPPETLPGFYERLLFEHHSRESMLNASRLLHQEKILSDPNLKPSEIVRMFTGLSELALLTAWIAIENTTAREHIKNYMIEWRHIRPATDGHTLIKRGLKPGPCFRLILDRLRDSYLDHEIANEADENVLLDKLINQEKICDDRI